MQESFLAFAVYVLTTNFLLSVFQKDEYIFMKRKRNLENLHCKCIHFRFKILIYNKLFIHQNQEEYGENDKKDSGINSFFYNVYGAFYQWRICRFGEARCKG